MGAGSGSPPEPVRRAARSSRQGEAFIGTRGTIRDGDVLSPDAGGTGSIRIDTALQYRDPRLAILPGRALTAAVGRGSTGSHGDEMPPPAAMARIEESDRWTMPLAAGADRVTLVAAGAVFTLPEAA